MQKIVIDIDENLYTRLFDNGDTDREDMLNACVAIRKGIPLSKECGRIIDIAIKTLSQHRWIPVSERLPEEETDVLICNENGDIELSRGSYSTEVKNDFIWYTSGWRFGKVIAWMPLPEPYKVERSDKE